MNKPRILYIPSDYDANIRDAIILKDKCLIPCLLQKYYDYEATIAAYSINQERLHKYFPECKFVHIKNGGSYTKNFTEFLSYSAMQYDILYIFGPYPCYNDIAAAYKRYNPDGKVYCKMDMNRYWLSQITSREYFHKLLRLCDVCSVESANIHKIINRKVPYDIELIPNGFYDTFDSDPISYSEKENIILTVGRLGTEQKQTNLLIEGFLKANISDWKLRLVGSVEPSFLPKLEKYKTHPRFSQVELVGEIFDRRELEREYRKAKIFCMTSKVEGFAHVLPEAAKNGCYIVSTDVDCSYDITDNGRLGTIIPNNDALVLSNALENICANEKHIKKISNEISKFCRDEYNWKYICGKLNFIFNLREIVK